MPTPNLYWPIYKNLEKEFLKLADYIHFSDDQLGTYSMFIADLIVRCSVEIESLSKELYCMLGGNMTPIDLDGKPRNLYFDTDCLNLLEERWTISKKQILVSAINLYFTDEKNKILTPLHNANKRGTSASKWEQAYQALKHNRKDSLKNASIKNLLHALGALYILNLYYKDEKTDIGRVYLSDHDFDNRAGSDIFSAHYCRATALSVQPHMDDSCIFPSLGDQLDKAIFVIKYDDASFKAMHENWYKDHRITVERFNKSPKIQRFLHDNPEYYEKSIQEICMAAGGEKLCLSIVSFQHAMQDKSTRMEAVLNKHSGIYPELLPLDDEKE